MNTVRNKGLSEALGLEQCSYPNVPDLIRTTNNNASALLGICIEGNLIMLNNLKTRDKHFPSKLTFRQGRQFESRSWIYVLYHQMLLIVLIILM